MAVASLAESPALAEDPRPRRWTRAEYYHLAEMGLFNGQQVMLIGGEIVVMSVQKSKHCGTIEKVRRVLEKTFGDGFWIRTQAPLDLQPDSDAEPDFVHAVFKLGLKRDR